MGEIVKVSRFSVIKPIKTVTMILNI